jgi:exodeoxyribonuclease VII large subunit
MAQKHLSLQELNSQVKNVLQDQFSVPVWIVAEISELRVNSSGHCYLELIEKEEDSDKVVARARGMIWSFTYRILQPYFRTATGADLTDGMKVLISVIVEYHEIYGLSLNIRDIDPAYTIGDIAKRRREVVNQLEQEGVLTMNKELD